jgi:hypothetical protein
VDGLTASVEELRAELARLGAERSQLAAERSQLAAEREHYHALYLAALEKMRKLELGLLGQKGERLPASDAQLSMALLAELLGREPTPHEKRTCTGVKVAESRSVAGRSISTRQPGLSRVPVSTPNWCSQSPSQ